MKVYPVALNIADRRCLVIGGGPIAARKIESLLGGGAVITVVSPEMVEEILTMEVNGDIRTERRCYRRDDLDGVLLAYAATDDDSLHEQIHRDARDAGVLLNVVDRPQWCDFIVPSIARRGDLVVAVSTSGQSPAMARRVRLDIERDLDPAYEQAISLFAKLRQVLVDLGWEYDRRKEAFEKLLEADLLGALGSSDLGQVDRILERCVGASFSCSSLDWDE